MSNFSPIRALYHLLPVFDRKWCLAGSENFRIFYLGSQLLTCQISARSEHFITYFRFWTGSENSSVPKISGFYIKGLCCPFVKFQPDRSTPSLTSGFWPEVVLARFSNFQNFIIRVSATNLPNFSPFRAFYHLLPVYVFSWSNAGRPFG